MQSSLDTLSILLQHEANELKARSRSPEIPAETQVYFGTQLRGVLLALSMVDAMRSGQSPGAGGRSRGAQHFHEYGELLPVGSAECFPAMAPEVRLEDGARMKFYAVHDLERDEAGVVHLRAVAPVVGVGNVDDAPHGRSLSD